MYSSKVNMYFNKMYLMIILFVLIQNIYADDQPTTETTEELIDYPIYTQSFELFNLDDPRCTLNACNYLKWVTLYKYNVTNKCKIDISQKVKINVLSTGPPKYKRTDASLLLTPDEFKDLFEFFLDNKIKKSIITSEYGYFITAIKHSDPFLVSISKRSGFGREAKLRGILLDYSEYRILINNASDLLNACGI